MDGDGSHAHRLSVPPPGASDSEPSISSLEQNAVAFVRTIGGIGQIAVKLALPESLGDSTGTSPAEILTHFPGGADEPSISDKGRIAFRVHTGSGCDIWVLGGSGTHRLADHGGAPGCDSAPAWSPDGRKVAFLRATGTQPQRVEALLVGVSGGAPKPLRLGGNAPGGFGWAPGRSLIFDEPGSDLRLEALGSDGQGRRTIGVGGPVEGIPAWSPGDDWAAVAALQPDGSTDIVTVASHGGPSVDLTRTPGISESHPSWAYATFPPLSGGGAPGPSVHSRSVRPGRRSSGSRGGRRHR